MLENQDLDTPIVHWLNEYAAQGIFTTDTALFIRGWNRWLEQNTGCAADTAIGMSLFEMFPDLVERRLDGLYQDALNGLESIVQHRLHGYLVRLPARPEYALPEMQQTARITPLVREGKVVGTITAIDDVSEKVVRENESIAAREAAEKVRLTKDRFLALLSHDLRTPLTAILGWAEIFRNQPANEQIVRRGVEVIERSASVQLELIEQILDLSLFTAGKVELNIQTSSVREIMMTALEALAPAAEAKGVRIDCVIPEEPRTAVLDPKRFQQIIRNLISHALKYTPKDGSVSATLAYSDNGFELTVKDGGKDSSAESLSNLFKSPWQAEGGDGHGGLGLRLAIVRNLVELHGGSVRAESLGRENGALFIVEMPWSASRANMEFQLP